jgi:hypothetical protein
VGGLKKILCFENGMGACSLTEKKPLLPATVLDRGLTVTRANIGEYPETQVPRNPLTASWNDANRAHQERINVCSGLLGKGYASMLVVQ